MPRVPGQMIGCVRNIENRRTAHEHAAAEIDVLQLAHACGERLVERVRGAGAPAVVHPVAALDDLDRLFGRRQLALIQCCEIHRDNLLIRSVHGVRPRPALLVYSLTIAYIILYLSVSVKHSRAICPQIHQKKPVSRALPCPSAKFPYLRKYFSNSLLIYHSKVL